MRGSRANHVGSIPSCRKQIHVTAVELVHAAITPAAIIEPQRRCAARCPGQRRLRHAGLVRRIAVRGACLCTPKICESAPRGAGLVCPAIEITLLARNGVGLVVSGCAIRRSIAPNGLAGMATRCDRVSIWKSSQRGAARRMRQIVSKPFTAEAAVAIAVSAQAIPLVPVRGTDTLRRRVVAMPPIADSLCSLRVLLILTRSGPHIVRCGGSVLSYKSIKTEEQRKG